MPRRILVATGLLMALCAVPLLRPRSHWIQAEGGTAPALFETISMDRRSTVENLFTFSFAGREVSLVEDLSESQCSPHYRLFSQGLFAAFDPGISGYRITSVAVTDLDRDGNPEIALTHREPCGSGGYGTFVLLEYVDGELVPNHLPPIPNANPDGSGDRERFRVTGDTVEVSFFAQTRNDRVAPHEKAKGTLVYCFTADGFRRVMSSDDG